MLYDMMDWGREEVQARVDTRAEKHESGVERALWGMKCLVGEERKKDVYESPALPLELDEARAAQPGMAER